MSSWRTTAAALVMALSAVFTAVGAFLDEDPNTTPNWDLMMTQVGAAYGFYVARDNKVTSEKAGAS